MQHPQDAGLTSRVLFFARPKVTEHAPPGMAGDPPPNPRLKHGEPNRELCELC